MIGAMSISSRYGRLLLAAAGVLLLAAALVAVQTARLKPVHEVRVIHLPGPARLDAAGCPVDRHCRPGSTAPPRMLAAVARALPGSRVLAVNTTEDATTGKPYRVTITASLGRALTLILIAQRSPGVRVNDQESFDGSGLTHTDLAGNAVTESRTLHAVVPGQPGFSAQLTLTSAGPTSTYDQAGLSLARDPDVQLTP